jgi:membrane protein DedA with SNARE-associated domain
MSRGFWTAIGAIIAFYLVGILGHAAGTAWAHSADDGGLGAIGSIVGLIIVAAIAWAVASRKRQ